MGATLTFSPQQISTSASLGSGAYASVIIRNNGAWTLYNAVLSGSARFSLAAPVGSNVYEWSSDGGTTWNAGGAFPIGIGSGYLLRIWILYTPLATPDYGIPDTGALTLTDDAPGSYPPGSTQTIVLYGVGLTEGVQYSLPTIYNTASGTIKAYLIVDPSLPALTIPSNVGILSLGTIKERMDNQASTVEIENVELKFAEDYTTYSEGFWFYVLNDPPQRAKDAFIMLTLMEGTNESVIFRGKILRESLTWDEYFLAPTSGAPTEWVRGVEMQLMSGIGALKNVSIAALVGECLQHLTAGTISAGDANFITLRAVLASAIHLAYGQTYDDTLLVNNQNDFYINVGGTNGLGNNDGTDYQWTECFIEEEYLGGMGTYSGLRGLFFDSSSSGAWINRFATAYDLLASICFSFGGIPRYTYGDGTGLLSATPTNNKHRIEINSRGTAGVATAFATMDGNIEDTKATTTSPTQPLRIRVSDFFGQTNDPNPALTDFGPAAFFAVNGIELSGEAPALPFNLDLAVDFYVGAYSPIAAATNSPPIVYRALLFELSPGIGMGGLKVWDYKEGAYYIWQTAIFQEWENALAVMLCYYLMQRFNPGSMQYDRTYGRIASTVSSASSVRNTKTLMGTTISDGITSRNFYASAVEKDFENNRVTITWIQQ